MLKPLEVYIRKCAACCMHCHKVLHFGCSYCKLCLYSSLKLTRDLTGEVTHGTFLMLNSGNSTDFKNTTKGYFISKMIYSCTIYRASWTKASAAHESRDTVSLSLIPLHFFVSMLRNFHGKLNSTLLLFYKHHMDIYQNFWLYPILFLGALLLFCPCLHVAPYFPDWFWIFLISQLRYQDFQLLSQIINVNKFPRISWAKFFRQCFQSYNKN